MSRKPFTILELLAVFVVIAILMGITLGIFSLVRDKMNNSKTRAIIKQLDVAMQSYKIDQGYYINIGAPSGTAFPANPTAVANIAWWFRLNPAGANNPDRDFIKCFEYQSLLGSKNIMTDRTPNYIVDPWGNPILYKASPGIFNPEMFDIGSLGRDGQYGSDGTNNSANFGQGDDITNFNNN